MAKIDFTRERTYGKSFEGILKLQGHVSSEGNLPLSAENGDIYSVGEDNVLYIFNGEWKTIGGSMLETPDWNVNDPSAPGYIANRPFYEGPGIDEISDARIYFTIGAQDYSKFIYVKGEKKYYFDFSMSTYAWTLATVDGDYVCTIDPESGKFTLANEEIGYSAEITSGKLIPDADSGDRYYETTQDIGVIGVVVHKIDEKYLPEPEAVPIKIVHGTLSGTSFTESEGEPSREQALSHILVSGGVVAIHVKDGQYGAVMAYSTGVSNGVITFTDSYSWGSVG